ncbi:outer membrane protein assembly factor BamB family protein [Tautonia plasticadhaerens]|uniref:Outer membrane biogenesis protein BamB n=1 Tax=Tautonia plasticadhaerens TaxID=2527974 RepID=A0A518H8F4_9BACT|nr:PQQ-binding-like beta-propeller repeat protein [Tautonia plasticadhaerens]QDV37046.1 outer membrane biogenesis protein BamB [Tautonia plasticadhaerens]
MATLEIHDGKGRVEYLTITRDQQVLIGSDPKCDIVLGDPSALPFHGRLRWKTDRYKIEATPEARAIEVDGKKVVSSSFRQGSELRVGKARVFLITPDDGPADFEKTKVRARPGAAVGGGWGGQMGGMPGEVAPPSFEADFGEVEEALDPPPGTPVRPNPRRRGGDRPAPSPSKARPPGIESPNAPSPFRSPVRWVQSILFGKDQAPGEERVLSSPVVIVLGLTVVLMISLGFGLYGIIREMSADRAYSRANESMENAEYRNAIERFDAYLDSYPGHEHASDARVRSAMSRVRQFTTGGNPAWASALEAAGSMFEGTRQEPAFDDSRADLASAVMEIITGLIDRAGRLADAEALSQAEAAIALHDRVGGSAATLARDRNGVADELEGARASVTKSRHRAEALAAMDAGLRAGDPEATYDARDSLVVRHPDLADDPEVVSRLRSANELLRKETSVEADRIRASTEPRPDPLGPPTSLVLRSTLEPADGDGSLAFAVADGLAYGIDPDHGAPVWHVPVGLDCPFPPVPIPGAGGDVLVVDARHDDLVRLDGADGRLVWRQKLGGPVADPPLILGNQIAQGTIEGRLLLFNVSTGERQGAVDLGRRLSRTPVSDELGRYYYVLGHSAVAFVIRRDPLECVAVEYIGHQSGAAACPPARLGKYFIVAENDRPDSGRWSIFQIGEDGTSLRLRQRLDHLGWTWETPPSSGQVIWSATDRGGISSYAIGPYEQEDPFKLIARTVAEGSRLGPTFAYARTDRELWVASARSALYQLDAEQGKISSGWTLSQAGAATAPPQVVEGRMILTQQPELGRGASLWCVEPRSGSVAWRTLLGSPWPTPAEPTPDGRGLDTLSGDGRRLLLPIESIEAGGFVQEMLPRPGDRRLPVGRLRRLEAGDVTLILPPAEADHLYVRGDGPGDLTRVVLPSPLAASPMVWGGNLLVPGVDGRAYLVDPRTGGPQADPLLPSFTGDGPLRWLDPALLDGDAVALADRDGTVRRLVREDGGRPSLMVEVEVDLNQELVAPPGSTMDTVILATADGWIRALAARDLSPAGAWELDAPLALGPYTDAATGTVVVADASGKVIAFGPGGERLWTIDLEGDTLAGPPSIGGDEVWLLTLGGTLHRRSLFDGASIDRFGLTPLPAGGPSLLGDALIVPVGPGTVRPMPLIRAESSTE